MISIKQIAAKAVLFVILSYPQTTGAQVSTSEPLLEWSEKQQDAYFQSSISMIAIVASQAKPEIAQCLNTWYGSDPTVHQKRHDQVRAVIRDNPGFHPQATILAVVQKACGAFAQ